MKMCPNCRNEVKDDAVFCPICGTAIGVAPQFHPQQAAQSTSGYSENRDPSPVITPAVPHVDPYDHTKDFDTADICENKATAMLMYLLGPLGILVALLAAGSSKYVAFHVKQAIKLTVAEILGILALTVISYLLWNIRLRVLMLFLIAVALIGLVALHLICVFQICKGKAVETYLVRKLKFLN